ncbi:MAG TPA: NADH-quinone oxidoreductase subunit A [Blastocatellia bacterium]|jgi:NADH-quinone oxidoreductase subunit A|nr:NADH-quinone oxidoreductase subunit A [Blastocatellia bacterium]
MQQAEVINEEVISYIPILLIFVFATGLATAMIILSRIAGRNRPNRTKLMPYECGVEPIGTARERQSVKFYLVAMIFLLFDIEAIFLVPWAVVFPGVLKEQAYSSVKYVFYGEMMVFMVILFVGLIYIWRKGILEWTR